jgi:hypothetical protein
MIFGGEVEFETREIEKISAQVLAQGCIPESFIGN